jgi:hypothetical protein
LLSENTTGAEQTPDRVIEHVPHAPI